MINRNLFQKFVDDVHYKPMVGEMMLRSQWDTFKQVFFLGDTGTIRAVLMVSSVFQALGFIFPGTLDRPLYAEMRFAPAWLWSTIFLIHAAGVWWRFRDHQNRLVAGFIVNLFGVFIWSFTTLLETFTIVHFSPAMAMEWTVIVAAFGALIRTGDKNDRTSA